MASSELEELLTPVNQLGASNKPVAQQNATFPTKSNARDGFQYVITLSRVRVRVSPRRGELSFMRLWEAALREAPHMFINKGHLPHTTARSALPRVFPFLTPPTLSRHVLFRCYKALLPDHHSNRADSALRTSQRRLPAAGSFLHDGRGQRLRARR